jgi:tetratricopeptide (TPR) repeat protein
MLMPHSAGSQEGRSLAGVRVAVLGKLSGMTRRDAQQLIRQHGGIALERPDATAHLLVVGDERRALHSTRSTRDLPGIDEATCAAVDRGEVQLIGETELWQRLGLVEGEQHIHRLYTPAMLADLLKLDVSVIRRWRRRGLLRPVRQVRKLPYFDYQQVLAARRLAELLSEGISLSTLEKRLAEWNRSLPQARDPLAEHSVVAYGRRLLLRANSGLVEPGGQHWFSFAGERADLDQVRGSELDFAENHSQILSIAGSLDVSGSTVPPEVLVQMAENLEDEGDLGGAADLYRVALAAGGPDAEVCFALAEVLYRLGDLSAARERYFMAIELDENYVEARANLGCLLSEQGQLEIAIAAFQGALRYHPDYADAHYHLAHTLHELDRPAEALQHWRRFLDLAPNSPWAAEARLIVELTSSRAGREERDGSNQAVTGTNGESR